METRRSTRGFASMHPDKQREIARKGGRSAHMHKTAHEFTTEEARAAGKKGGERVSLNREHMARIGQLGGRSSASRRRNIGAEGGNEPVMPHDHKSMENEPVAPSHQGDMERLSDMEASSDVEGSMERSPENAIH